jgi:hypothetical protein
MGGAMKERIEINPNWVDAPHEFLFYETMTAYPENYKSEAGIIMDRRRELMLKDRGKVVVLVNEKGETFPIRYDDGMKEINPFIEL